MFIYQHNWTMLYRHRQLLTHTHAHPHTNMHAHTYKCAHTNTIQTVGVKDNNTQLKCSEKRNVLSLFLKKWRELECLTSWGRLFQMIMRTEIEEPAKAMSFAVEASEFEYACV